MLGIKWEKKLKRKPQVILPKDIGLIVSYAGIGSGDKIVEGGSGSGFLALFLANVVGENGKIYSYEKRKDFLDVAKYNAKKLGLSNIIEFKNKDILDFEEKNINAIILDIPNPWDLLEKSKSALLDNGIFISYLPNLTQVHKLINNSKNYFNNYLVLESINREYIIEENKIRPINTGLLHTGYVCFLYD